MLLDRGGHGADRFSASFRGRPKAGARNPGRRLSALPCRPGFRVRSPALAPRNDERGSQRSAAPVGLVGAGCRPLRRPPALDKENRGRAGRQGSGAHSSLRGVRKQKCSDPRASAPHDTEACRNGPASRFKRFARATQVRQSQGVPRAVFEACSARSPVVGPYSRYARWGCTAICPPYEALALGQRSSDENAGIPAVGGLGARQARRETSGLDRRACTPHLRCTVIPRPPLPAPCLKMLYRHPSVTRRDDTEYDPRLWRDYDPSAYGPSRHFAMR